MELTEKGKSAIDILNSLETRLSNTNEIISGFRQKGQSRVDVLEKLQKKIEIDLTYSSGHILGAMTTEPHDFARYVYSKYIERNLGDCGLVPGTKSIERETIQMLGGLLSDPFVTGNIVSGGTEANMIAMYLAKKTHPNIKFPEVVVPDSAHYSFDKSADLMGLTIRRAQLNENFEVDLNHFESLINENTIAAVGVAGTTALGLIDPLESMGKIIKKHNLFFHVDGAFGGFIFPFLKALGHSLPEFDLSIPEIMTYTIDPHKMGMGVIPSGAILVREKTLTDFGFEIPYLAGGGYKSLNLLGTRPGAAAISVWALMHHLGKEGYVKIAKNCWENTQYFIDQIQSIPQLKLATNPIAPVIGLQIRPEVNMKLCEFDAKLRAKGWALGIFKQYQLARVVLMPHIHLEHIDAFIHDLKQIFS